MARYHILIVDDQRDVRLLLRSSLETLQLDLEVVDVPSAEEALLVLGKEKFDLLVTDIRLPGMSGLELRDRAGRRMPKTQLILITGMTDEKVQREVAQSGAAAYFFKPIQIAPFLDEVCKCLGVQPVNPRSQEIAPPITPSVDLPPPQTNPLEALCTHQAVIGGWILTGQGKTLYECRNLAGQNEIQNLKRLVLSLSEQDYQQVQSAAGIAFPCHHLFSGQVRDLWISSLGPDLVLAIALRAGEAGQKAAGLLLEIEKLRSALPVLQREEVETSIGQETGQVIDEVVDQELSTLLGQASEHSLQSDELAAYWDHLSQEDQPVLKTQGVMSFEDALRLGLAPGENTT